MNRAFLQRQEPSAGGTSGLDWNWVAEWKAPGPNDWLLPPDGTIVDLPRRSAPEHRPDEHAQIPVPLLRSVARRRLGRGVSKEVPFCESHGILYALIGRWEEHDAEGRLVRPCTQSLSHIIRDWPRGSRINLRWAQILLAELKQVGWVRGSAGALYTVASGRDGKPLPEDKNQLPLWSGVQGIRSGRSRSSTAYDPLDLRSAGSHLNGRQRSGRSFPSAGPPLGGSRPDPDPEDLDKNRIESRILSSQSGAEKSVLVSVTAATPGYLPPDLHHRRCESRRIAGLRIPVKMPTGSTLPLTEEQLRDHGAFADKNRDGETVAWLFPDEGTMGTAMQQAESLIRQQEAKEARRQAVAEAKAQRQDAWPQPTPEAAAVWTVVLGQLRGQIAEKTVELWLKTIVLLSVSSSQATLMAPNRFLRDWVTGHYLTAIGDALRHVLGEMPHIHWCTDYENDKVNDE